MALTDELKILDDKIKANQPQYDLDRKAAKMSALSSKELDKYENLSGEDLGYKPGLVEKVRIWVFSISWSFKKKDEKRMIKSIRLLNTKLI